MEDFRDAWRDEEQQLPDEEGLEWSAQSEDEVPFHVPRD